MMLVSASEAIKASMLDRAAVAPACRGAADEDEVGDRPSRSGRQDDVLAVYVARADAVYATGLTPGCSAGGGEDEP